MLQRVPPREKLILGLRLRNLQGTNIMNEVPEANSFVGRIGMLDSFNCEGFSSRSTLPSPSGPWPQT